MIVYKFLDLTNALPEGFTPLIVISTSGNKVRAHIEPELLEQMKHRPVHENMRAIKELLAVLEQSLLTYAVDTKPKSNASKCS